MGKTMSEKILSKASGQDSVSPEEIVWANIDRAMMDDILGPRVEIAEKLEQLNAEIWDAEKVVVISDHYTPRQLSSRRKSSSLPATGATKTASKNTSNSPGRATR